MSSPKCNEAVHLHGYGSSTNVSHFHPSYEIRTVLTDGTSIVALGESVGVVVAPEPEPELELEVEVDAGAEADPVSCPWSGP